MKIQTINLNKFCSSLGFFLLFIIFSGSELKANTSSPLEKTFLFPKEIKWVRYHKPNKDKDIEIEKIESQESNKQLIAKVKKEDILEKKEVEIIKKLTRNQVIELIISRIFKRFKKYSCS